MSDDDDGGGGWLVGLGWVGGWIALNYHTTYFAIHLCIPTTPVNILFSIPSAGVNYALEANFLFSTCP